MKRLRIGLDFHSVISDDQPIWFKEMTAKNAECPHRPGWESELIEGYAPTWSFPHDICPPCFIGMLANPYVQAQSPAMPGAVEGIKALSKHAKLHLISSGQQATAIQGWLHRKRLSKHFQGGMWFNETAKGHLCNSLRLDYHVDDAPQNIESIRAAGGRTIPVIFDMPYNRHLTGLRVANWTQLMELLGGSE